MIDRPDPGVGEGVHGPLRFGPHQALGHQDEVAVVSACQTLVDQDRTAGR
ncbi:hypothetical protein [Pseudonocardia nigra]|nr:hypothetical protein [Pseudonocardia nigra]